MAAQVVKEERNAAPETPAFQPPKKKKKWGKRLLIGLLVVGVVGGLSDMVYQKKISDYAAIKYRRRFLEMRRVQE